MAIYWCLSSPLPEVGALYSGLVSRTRIDSTGRPPEGTLPMTVTTPTTTAAPATGQGAGPRAWGFTLLGLVRIFIGFYFLWAFADKLLGLGFSTPKERSEERRVGKEGRAGRAADGADEKETDARCVE